MRTFDDKSKFSPTNEIINSSNYESNGTKEEDEVIFKNGK